MSAVVTTVGLLLAGLCFWQGLPALTGTGHRATASTLSQSGGRELITTPIEELVPLDRVIAENPELAGQHVPQRTIDPRIDRLVSFTQTHPDGSITEWTRVERLPELLIGLLLADETAFDDLADDASDAAFAQSLIGRTVDVELSDLGASGPATILNVAPCPEPEADDGTGRRLVTAVFRHTSSNIVDVTLDDGTPSIGSTGNHPYWSEDRQAYIRAEELRPRERLRKVNDTFCRVASVTKRHLTEPVTVYNVEVDGQHVYFVGDSGVLVHNLCTQTWDTSSNSKILRKNLGDMVKKGEEAHHIVASTHRRADKARKLLGRYGIDINSADNGVGLANGLHHGNGLHSYKGIDEVLRRLKTAEKHAKAAGGNCSQALKDELKAMADEMRIRQFQIPN